MATDVRAEVRSFIAAYVGDHELPDDQNIFAAGLVNSLFALQLVLFVENSLGVLVADTDLEIDNFSSVEAIVRFVARKQG